MNKCNKCDAIITPCPEIERYTKEPMKLCMDCFTTVFEQVYKISKTEIEV